MKFSGDVTRSKEGNVSEGIVFWPEEKVSLNRNFLMCGAATSRLHTEHERGAGSVSLGACLAAASPPPAPYNAANILKEKEA